MKTVCSIFIALLFLTLGCKEQPLAYTVPLLNTKTLNGKVWKKGEKSSLFTDLYITEHYYAFSENDNDTVLKVFHKNEPQQCVAYEIIRSDDKTNHSIDFVKCNTRYESGTDEIWWVENKHCIKHVGIQEKMLISKDSHFLPRGLTASVCYNFTKDEIYGIPSNRHATDAFYFFRPDSGYYWVEMYGATKNMQTHYKKNPYAFLANLRINEKQDAIVCAFLFINHIQFTDLRGNIIRSVKIGETNAAPVNNIEGSLDYERSTKYILDICGTDKYVYCLFNGSTDFSNNTYLCQFKWNGTHVRTYQTDRKLKKIAYDKFSQQLVALAAKDNDSRDVVCYEVK